MVPASSKEFLDIQANCRVQIHSETRTLHDNNIRSNFFLFTIYFSFNMIFFFWIAIKQIKSKNLVHLALLNHIVKRYDRFHKHKFLFLDDQYFFQMCRLLKRKILSLFYQQTNPKQLSDCPYDKILSCLHLRAHIQRWQDPHSYRTPVVAFKKSFGGCWLFSIISVTAMYFLIKPYHILNQC